MGSQDESEEDGEGLAQPEEPFYPDLFYDSEDSENEVPKSIDSHFDLC